MIDWFILILLIVLAGLLVIGWYFSSKIIHPKTHPHEFSFQHEVEHGSFDPGKYAALPREDVIIQSPHGYDLHGLYFEQPDAQTVVIISHGITWNYEGSIKYMMLFYRLGWSILIYDNRNHGFNQKVNTTFGFYEKHDLIACIDWVQERCGTDIQIGLMGESLGAGITLQAAAVDKRASFIVVDCPYSDLQQLLELRAREDYHVPFPGPMIKIADWFVYLRAGFHVSQVSPIQDLKDTTTPILFIHGADDTYICPEMSVEMYQQHPETRRLYLVPGAGHAESIFMDRMRYEQIVDEFLEEFVQIKIPD